MSLRWDVCNSIIYVNLLNYFYCKPKVQDTKNSDIFFILICSRLPSISFMRRVIEMGKAYQWFDEKDWFWRRDCSFLSPIWLHSWLEVPRYLIVRPRYKIQNTQTFPLFSYAVDYRVSRLWEELWKWEMCTNYLVKKIDFGEESVAISTPSGCIHD